MDIHSTQLSILPIGYSGHLDLQMTTMIFALKEIRNDSNSCSKLIYNKGAAQNFDCQKLSLRLLSHSSVRYIMPA